MRKEEEEEAGRRGAGLHAPLLSLSLSPPSSRPRHFFFFPSQLASTEEFVDGKLTGELGEVFIRCNNVLYMRAAPEEEGGGGGGGGGMES
jgi:hypothetical protein